MKAAVLNQSRPASRCTRPSQAPVRPERWLDTEFKGVYYPCVTSHVIIDRCISQTIERTPFSIEMVPMVANDHHGPIGNGVTTNKLSPDDFVVKVNYQKHVRRASYEPCARTERAMNPMSGATKFPQAFSRRLSVSLAFSCSQRGSGGLDAKCHENVGHD